MLLTPLHLPSPLPVLLLDVSQEGGHTLWASDTGESGCPHSAAGLEQPSACTGLCIPRAAEEQRSCWALGLQIVSNDS